LFDHVLDFHHRRLRIHVKRIYSFSTGFAKRTLQGERILGDKTRRRAVLLHAG
jgi:hypothetical protein